MSTVNRLADRVLNRLVPKRSATAGVDYWICDNGRWMHCRSGVGCVDTGEGC